MSGIQGALLGGHGSGAAAYSGPGDRVSGANGWWGLRAYNLAKAGTATVRLIRSSDSSQADISTLSNGNLNVSDAFFNGSTYKIVTLYNQGADGATLDATQGTDANRPAFVLSGLGSLPIIRVAGSQFLATGGSSTLSQPNWVSSVVNRTGATTSYGSSFGETASACAVGFNNTTNTVNCYAGSAVLTATANDSTWHAVQTVLNGASSEIYVDGSNTTGTNPGSGGVFLPIFLFKDGFGAFMTGDCGEIGFWNNVAPDLTQKSNINSNQHTYWGF